MLRARLAAAAVATALAGCAGQQPPDFGERLASESGAVAEIGRDWNAGQASVERGRRLVEEGRDDVDRGEDLASSGRKKIRRGENLIDEGEEAMEEAEATYRDRAASAPAT